MKLSDLLCRFKWYRRLRGGTWHQHGNQWFRVSVEVFTIVDLCDDISIRDDIQEFLKVCDKENQRERT